MHRRRAQNKDVHSPASVGLVIRFPAFPNDSFCKLGIGILLYCVPDASGGKQVRRVRAASWKVSCAAYA